MKLVYQKSLFLGLIGLILLVVLSSSCTKDIARLPEEVSVSVCDSLNVKYSTDIIDIMQLNCAISGCHDGSSGAPLDLNVYSNVKTFVDNGQLKSRVIDLKNMPPSGPLSDTLLLKLKCWIDAGAPNN